MMEFAWNPRVGWLAGAEGTGRPDVCFASWVESTPNGNLSQAREVRLPARPLFPKARWQSLPRPRLSPGEPAGGQRAGHGAETPWPGSAQQQTLYRPHSGRMTHGRGTTTQPRPGNVALGLWQRLMLARLLLAHSRMAQAKANKPEANAKGLGLLSESDPGIRARSKGGAGAGGWGRGGGKESLLAPLGQGVRTLRESERAPAACCRPCGGKEGQMVWGVSLCLTCVHMQPASVCRVWSAPIASFASASKPSLYQ